MGRVGTKGKGTALVRGARGTIRSVPCQSFIASSTLHNITTATTGALPDWEDDSESHVTTRFAQRSTHTSLPWYLRPHPQACG